MPLIIHQSNRLEILSRLLAQQVRQTPKSVLSPEVIIVQSRGMERWLSLELARQNGICANCAFPFPNRFLHRLAAAVLPDLPDTDPYGVDIMTARMMKFLPSYLDRSEFAALKTYLRDDPTQEKIYQLSYKIAALFDQYTVFRPEMILSWDRRASNESETHRWQSLLWRRLVQDTAAPHRVELQRQLLAAMRSNPDRLPDRVAVFAVTYLPPFHLNVLAALSDSVAITIYYLNPSRAYWGDIVTDSEAHRIADRYQIKAPEVDTYFLQNGNPLLAAWGKQGRDFLELISELECDVQDHFQNPAPETTLARLQSDILDLRDPIPADVPIEPAAQSETIEYPSILINACHSPMREMEVLYDQVLAWLDADPHLSPGDIVVMAPDIEVYSPFVNAVFEANPGQNPRIPFSISDRSTAAMNPLYNSFSALLDLYQSRFRISQILALLDIPELKQRYQLNDTDVEMMTDWLHHAGVRWGVDGAHRTRLGLDDTDQNTWQSGFKRLLLGYAMKRQPPQLFSNMLPDDRVEGQGAVLLGRLLTFFQQIVDFAEGLDHDKTLVDWRHHLCNGLSTFFETGEGEQEALQTLRLGLDELGCWQAASGLDQPLPFPVVRAMLNRIMNRTHSSAGFLTGGITFCSLLPMRSIPFKIVCLIGLNHDAFPRDASILDFDLIARRPRSGDRSPRNDDKYLFLEALLSARQTLYISYTGRDKQDNAAKPPSVLASQLLAYLKNGYGLHEEQVTCQHRLQAYSPDYFQSANHRLFSYSAENLAACRMLTGRSNPPPPFFDQPLEPPGDRYKRLDLIQLCRFFRHPARYLLRYRLDVILEDDPVELSDSEHFRLDDLEKYDIQRFLFAALRNGDRPDDLFQVQQSKGKLPHGNVGRQIFNQLCAEVASMVAKTDRICQGPPLPASTGLLEINGFALNARLADVYPNGQVLVRFTRLNAKSLLAAWMHHLAYCTIASHHHGHATHLVCKDAIVNFSVPLNAAAHLADLLDWYWMGMSQPLPFFPESSHAFSDQYIDRRKPIDVALKRARQKWSGNEFIPGEGQDDYMQLCFSEIDPFDQRFQEIALGVFAPLLAHRRIGTTVIP